MSFLSMIKAMSDLERTLYMDVTSVNTSDCLHLVEQLPLRYYQFKYESRSQRGRQLGVIGEELTGLLPEAVEVVASRVFPNPEKGQPPITVTDLAVVDKNILFMYNIGAIQALAAQQDELEGQLEDLMKLGDEQYAKMESNLASIRAGLELRVSEEAKEVLRKAELEKEKAKLVTELARVQLEEEKKAMDKQAEEETKYAELLAKESEERLREEEVKLKKAHEMEVARTLQAIKAREEVAKKREEMRGRREVEFKEKELELMTNLEELKRQGDLERVKAEAQARADAERQNEDIALRSLRAQAEEDRKRALEMINLVMEKISQGAMALLDDPQRLLILIAMFIIFFACYYTVREALALTRKLIESKMGKPKLVRETSKTRWGEWMSILPASILRATGLIAPLKAQSDEVVAFFQDVVLPPDLRSQVYRLAVSTRNAKANAAPYRHLLLHGKPGTGKTMVAKRLAISSGMDYAVMSGGDVAPLGKEAVTELHKLFQWAEKSPRGLLLFIDEAEAFLSARGTAGISEDRRNALNALLYQTGQQSYQFMMVLATNRPQDLDPAVLDRMDDYLGFTLPTPIDRFNMLKLYYTNLIIKRQSKGADKLNDAEFRAAAEALNGFSGREISKLMLSVLNAVYGTADGVMTCDLFRSMVKQKVEEHKHKDAMLAGGHDR